MQHHHELAAMQSLHAQQLESLSRRHQQELEGVQEEFTDGGSSQQEPRHSANKMAAFEQQCEYTVCVR